MHWNHLVRKRQTNKWCGVKLADQSRGFKWERLPLNAYVHNSLQNPTCMSYSHLIETFQLAKIRHFLLLTQKSRGESPLFLCSSYYKIRGRTRLQGFTGFESLMWTANKHMSQKHGRSPIMFCNKLMINTGSHSCILDCRQTKLGFHFYVLISSFNFIKNLKLVDLSIIILSSLLSNPNCFLC